MPFGWDDAALLGLMAADWGYHRFLEDKPQPQPAQRIELPRVDDGAPLPMLFGRCRVKSPIIAWADKPLFEALPESGDPTYHYFLSMMLVLGIPFDNGVQKLLAMYFGDKKYVHGSGYDFAALVGDGSDYPTRWADVEDGTIGPTTAWPSGAFGGVEFLDGNPLQTLVDNTYPYTERSWAGKHMTQATVTGSHIQDLYGNIDPRDVPGYRGVLSAFLFDSRPAGGDTLNHWCVGDQASVAQYSFEVQTLPDVFLGPNRDVAVLEGDIYRTTGDANPADVIYSILTGAYGKLALNSGLIDTDSFAAAATTLDTEGNGYSNAFEGGATASDMIQDVLKQIDGGVFVDPSTGKLVLRLVRPDYDPSSLDTIDPSNCESITNFTAAGWTGIPTSARLSFPDRAQDYTDNSAVAPNEANSVGDNGERNELVIRMSGVRELANAANIASREMAARGRPFMKFRAVVNRKFYKKLPIDCVKLTWPEWGIKDVVFRIAAINRGTIESGKITLDLIQDYYYVWRGNPPVHPERVVIGGLVHA